MGQEDPVARVMQISTPDKIPSVYPVGAAITNIGAPMVKKKFELGAPLILIEYTEPWQMAPTLILILSISIEQQGALVKLHLSAAVLSM